MQFEVPQRQAGGSDLKLERSGTADRPLSYSLGRGPMNCGVPDVCYCSDDGEKADIA